MNVEIAQRLSARRKQSGLSQEALAEKLGVSRQAVSKWERSESSPDTDNLIALAQLYGLSLDDLLYVDEEIRDDVTFEAADRAAKRQAEQATATRRSRHRERMQARLQQQERAPRISREPTGRRTVRRLRSLDPPTARSPRCVSGWEASMCSMATTTCTCHGVMACT